MSKLTMDEFFKVIWVPPEVKDKVVEPLTSVEEITGKRPENEEFKNVVTGLFGEMLGIEIKEGQLKRDEIFGYEKQRALAFKA